MRRSFRSLQSVGLTNLHADPFSYVCQSCRHHVLRQRISQLQSIRRASNLPFTERVRRGLWGTDNPPGLKDPYGGPGYFERRRQRAHAERGEEPRPLSPPRNADISERQDPPDGRYRSIEDISWASVPTEDPERTDPNYVPAETWDGLKRVGGTVHWSKRPSMPEEEFRPYLATFEKATTHNEILSALHQAVVEVVTLNDNISLLSNDLFQTTHTQEASAVISSTSIELDNTGKQLVLRYEDGAKEKILDSICGGFAKRFTSPDHMPPTSDGVEVQISETSKDLDGRSNHSSRTGQMRASQAVEEVEGNEQYSRMGEDKPFDGNEESSMDTVSSPPFRRRIPYPVVSLDFLTLPVESPEQRFYIIKRLSQLTGYRIPDPVIASSRTLLPVYNYLSRDSVPKPKKLADRLLAKQDVVSLPNVHIMARRETPVDKDKQVGRWKMIEAELQSKGLPVPGKLRA